MGIRGSKMSILGSSPEKGQILALLSECGFTDANNFVVGMFATEIMANEDIRISLLDSFQKQRNAKGAIGLSTNANIRTMSLVLEFWMDTYPSEPIPRDVKKQLQRSVFDCSDLAHLFAYLFCLQWFRKVRTRLG
jgi:hypothetical protein